VRHAAVLAVCAIALAGCGSGERRASPPPPRLPAGLAASLASRSDEVARLLDRNDGCGALAAAKALQQQAIAAINTGRVPPRLQEPLGAAANDLVFRIHCAPRPAPAPVGGHNQKQPGHGKEKGHGKGDGKGHGKGKRGGED
jgi:hypothetical protein